MSEETPGKGRRALIVEDEPLIAMMLEDMLDELGYAVVGVAPSVDKALAKIGAVAVDIAILDVNLGGVRSTPVAAALSDKDTPFIIATGAGEADLPPELAGRPVLNKPFDLASLGAALASLDR